MDGNSQRHTFTVATGTESACADEAIDGAPDLGGAIDIMVSETGGALAGVGFTHAQFVLLLAVSEFEPVPIESLDRIIVDGQRRREAELQALLSKGAVSLCEDQTPQTTVVTTAHGRTLLQRAIPLWEAAQGRIRDRLGVEDTCPAAKGDPSKPVAIG